MKKSLGDKKRRILAYTCLGVGLFLLPLAFAPLPKKEKIENDISSYNASNESDFLYLSDVPYIKDQSSVGYGSITLDGNINTGYNNGLITLNIDGVKTSFIKGVLAHAPSTLIYDISSYHYDYFTSYIGVDQSTGTNGNGVKFAIYTSMDGENWDLQTAVSPPVLKGTSNALSVKIDIQGKKYLKLIANSNGDKGSDHAVYANAKLIKKDYQEEEVQPVDFIKTVEEYDRVLHGLTLEQQLTTGKLTLLQREFVKNVGYDYLQMYAGYSEEVREVLRWLMTDYENLNLYTMGGKPSGNYLNSLKVLVELYKNYHNDWDIKEVSKHGAVKGEVYKKMAITLSLTHSTKVALWMQPNEETNQSNAVVRYSQFKKLYDEGKFKATESIDITPWFEDYSVEEMRYIMNTALDDEEVFWLNDYTQSQINAHPNSAWSYLTPHPYMAYVWPNYGNPVFHDSTRKDYWDQKYNGIFSKYGVTYSSEGHMVYKVWMNFRTEFGTGAVCGGISKTGSNIRAVHGIPAAVIGQPGHAAIIYYNRNSEGKGYWGIDNDVSGWTLSEKSERLPLGWGNDKRYVKGYNVPYIVMAQEAINRMDQYEKSAKLIMLADSYQSDKVKREYYLRESIKALDFNVDAWYALIDLYINDETKTEEEIYNLADEMSEALLEYPLPFYNLMAKIQPKLTSNAYKFKYSLLLTGTLNEGKVYNGTDVLQPGVTRAEAAYLLGQTDTSLATFSFDGEDAGKIVLSKRFDGSGIRWDYSLDGKNTWNEVSFTGEDAHKLQLTKEQIASITEENDIYVHIVGVNYSEENLYKIDITKGVISSTLYNNDLENSVIGVNTTYEWRMRANDPWTSYKDAIPDLTGDKTVQVRVGATGTHLPSDEVTYSFTMDNQPDTRKYVPISHLSIHKVSTEATNHAGGAVNAIDGNYNTRYHSDWNGGDTERYITIKLDEPMAISAVEFVPAGGGNGKIYDGTIYGSMDGENFEVLTSKKNLSYKNSAETAEEAKNNTKSFDIGEPQVVRYIKIVANRTNGNWFAARAFNFYQDTTKEIEPFVEIEYSTTSLTNQNVIAKVVSRNSPIKVLNNNGKTNYEFTKNGTFTFEYEDVYGNQKEIDASVTWIDKEVPTASIQYSTTFAGSGPVIATLIPNGKSVTVTNNNGQETYTFTTNGTFEFIYRDAFGNIGKTTAKVDWITPGSNYIKNTVSSNATSIPNKALPTTGNAFLDNDQQNSRVEFRSYSTNHVILRLPAGSIQAMNTLKEESLALSDTLKNRVGERSQYFEVYFENGTSKRETLDSISMEMIFKIDPTKKLLAIYEVGESDILRTLNYQSIGNNQVILETTGLGKYILSYTEKDKEEASISESDSSQDFSSKENIVKPEKEAIQPFDNLHFWLIGGVSIILIAFGIYLFKRKNDSKEHFVRVNYN